MKVEVEGAILRRRHAHHPGRQVAAGAGDQRVHQKRRQGEVVNAVRLIGIAKVRQVLAVGDVGLGDDNRVGLGALDDQAKQSDQLVRLGQIHAGGAALLPQERHGVQPENAHPGIQQLTNDGDELHDHRRIGEIEIHLIRTEGAPHRPLALLRGHMTQQRRGPGPDHVAGIKVSSGAKK